MEDPDYSYLYSHNIFSDSSLELPLSQFLPKDAESQFLDLISMIITLGFSRGVYQHYDSPEDLIRDNRRNLIVKPSHMEMPLVLKYDTKTGTMSTEAANTQGFSKFLKSKFIKIGLPGISFS
jgi:hypothetical protein